ncbi:hypothetical protein [Paenibacillus sp. FJAT-27812]|uniref:hypothetical protein n=1 Tax=Paenibacillus sp. FJAT-27812 TaxID=1684143 RepID=UPI0006A7CCDF|nr:hypothetical protein [Paenibacillus sp. FJAT-27812]
MDTVTLNHEQYLSFTGWSESHCMKQTVSTRRQRLEDMGADVVTVDGKGKGAIYTIRIPAGFYRMLLVDVMRYSPVGAEYIDMIMSGRDIVHCSEGSYVKFSVELYTELAAKYGLEYKAVEATCTRIRNFLHNNGYIVSDSPTKTHRVKRSKLVGGRFVDEWVIGDEAVANDQKARDIWISFFKQKLDAYREIDPDANSIPHKLIGHEMKQLYSFGMKDKLNVEYYRVAKKTQATEALLADINYTRDTFLRTLDLGAVLTVLRDRQSEYRIRKQEQREQAQKNEVEIEATQPTKDELEELRQRMKLIELQKESNCPPATEEQKQQLATIIDELFPLIEIENEHTREYAGGTPASPRHSV